MHEAGSGPEAAGEPGPVEAEVFRRAMRHPASAVAVIAAGAPGGRAGITATAVCSLSDAPPSLLVCVNRNARLTGVIRASASFSVNFLGTDQVALAEVFAGRAGLAGERRFDDRLWATAVTGAPVLADCLASFDCRLDGEYQHATHSIFIGRVVAIAEAGHRHGLVYSRGAFRRIAPME